MEKGSPAQDAGLRAGDVIVAIDGRPVNHGNDVRNIVGLRERGSEINFSIIRDGERMEVTVRVSEQRIVELSGDTAIPQLAGVRITEIPDDHPQGNDVRGVYAAEVAEGSPAWRLGLRTGDIIIAVNRQDVNSVAEFERAAKGSKGVLALNVLRGDAQLFIVVR